MRTHSVVPLHSLGHEGTKEKSAAEAATPAGNRGVTRISVIRCGTMQRCASPDEQLDRCDKIFAVRSGPDRGQLPRE